MALFRPSKIVGIGLNYHDHAQEMQVPVPPAPMLFLKAPSALLQNGQEIIYPRQSREVHYEGELAVIIKDRIRCISPGDAARHILGFSCANDVTARDLQRQDGQWARSKSFDTFCPLGPRIVSDLDPRSLRLTTRVNGRTRQNSTTGNMIFDVFDLVAYVSSVMTLEPDDVIITGTPAGVGPLSVGDVVEVEIEGIGILRNSVAEG